MQGEGSWIFLSHSRTNANSYEALTEQETLDKLKKSREHAAQGMYRDATEVSRDMRINMNIEILPMEQTDIDKFKQDIQEAFQKGFEEVYGKIDGTVLPEKDIDRSLNAIGSVAYKAVANGEMIGGAVVVIDEKTKHNHLDLLYVKYGTQTKGVGFSIWSAIEKLHPDTKVWETCTPYFEKRNIHFYVNKCGFHIVEYLSEHNPDPNSSEDFIGDGGEGMFVFRKMM